MSDSGKITELITAVDKATKPFKAFEKENISLSDSIKKTKTELNSLHTRFADLNSFIKAQTSLKSINDELKTAQERTKKLHAEIKKGGKSPTRKQIKQLNKNNKHVSKLKQQRSNAQETISQYRKRPRRSGENVISAKLQQAQLKNSISDKKNQLKKQKSEKHQQIHQSLGIARDKATRISSVSMSFAKGGFNIGKNFLMHGYEKSLEREKTGGDEKQGYVRSNNSADVKALQSVSHTRALGNTQANEILTFTAPANEKFKPDFLKLRSQPESEILTHCTKKMDSQTVNEPSTSDALQSIKCSCQLLPASNTVTNNDQPAAGGAAISPGDLGTDLQALQQVYDDLSVDIFKQQEPSLRALVQTATDYLGRLQQWVQDNQGLVQTFGLIAGVVISVAGAIGIVASIIAPIISGIGILIAVATTVGSVFATVFGAIGAVITAISTPILLVAGLILTVIGIVLLKLGYLDDTIKWISKGFDKVKSFFGFGKPENNEPAPSAGVGNIGVATAASTIQQGNSQTSFNSYKAIKSSAGNSFTDQSKTEINVSLQGDVSPGSDNHRYVQQLLAEHENNKRNNALSQFSAMGGLAT